MRLEGRRPQGPSAAPDVVSGCAETGFNEPPRREDDLRLAAAQTRW